MEDVTFHVEIACTGALLGSRDFEEAELRRILHVVSDKLGEGRTEGALHDANGNRVGSYWFEDAR